MASVLQLHLKYRLWIAEMNADINALRIFNDYLNLLKEANNNKQTEKQLETYEKCFAELRTELDNLRHEMHIIKMKLATFLKEKQTDVDAAKAAIGHAQCKEHYKAFREKFDTVKKEFKQLEIAE